MADTIYMAGDAITGTDSKKAKKVNFKKHLKYMQYKVGADGYARKASKKVFSHMTTFDGTLLFGKGTQYLNYNTGHLYKCTKAGVGLKVKGRAFAEWKYVRTYIIGPPTQAVKSLSVTRDGGGSHTMRATWKTPDALRLATSGIRCSGFTVTWTVVIAGKKNPIKVVQAAGAGAEAATLNLNNFDATSVPKGFPKSFDRNSFYPYTGHKIESVSVAVVPKNAAGVGTSAASDSYKFGAPRKPSVSALAHNAQTGRVSGTITTDAGNDKLERALTQYEVIVEDTSKTGSQRTRTTTSNSSGSTSLADIGYDVTNRFQLTYAQHVKVTVRARARGYNGDSAWAQSVHYVSFPAVATLSKPIVNGKAQTCSSRDSTGKMTVNVATNSTKEHPVDRIILEALVNTTAMTAEVASGTEGWQEMGAVDNDKCTALTCAVGDVYPETRGHTTWVRAKTWHDIEDVFYRYSAPIELTELKTPIPTAADDECDIIRVTPAADGKSMVVVCAWDKVGAGSRDDATGTQLTWSDAEDAWTSTEGPDEHEFTWRDATSASSAYYYTGTITVKGLKEGVPYHFRARRYMDDEDGRRTFGAWSDMKTAMAVTAPGTVVLVPESPVVTRGRDVRFSWTFDSSSAQVAWELLAPDNTIIARGNDAMGSYTIPAARIAGLYGASAASMSARVRVSTGGDFVTSESVTVLLADPPTLAVSMAALSTAQPLSFSAESSATCSLACTLYADGGDGAEPAGKRAQAARDTVWTSVVAPTWTASGGSYGATVTLPAGLDLLDKCGYTLEVVATDPSTGLQSPMATAHTAIAWAHQAPSPSPDTSITPNDGIEDEEDDPNAIRQPRCTISLVRADGHVDGDVYDIYRVTQDGAELAGRGFVPPPPERTYAKTADTEVDEGKTYYAKSGDTYTEVATPTPEGLPDYYELTSIASLEIVDEYAPMGDGPCAYRVVTRTPDGDMEWRDFDYTLPCEVLRFDWDGNALELPYDISLGDSWSKDFESRAHLDGDVQGYWGASTTRKATLSADLVRAEDDLDQTALRALAKYAGPVCVRTPDASRFDASVSVSIDQGADSPLTAVSIDADAIAPTGTYDVREAETEEP